MLNSSRGLRRVLGVALVALLVLTGCTPPRHQSPVVETAAPIVPDDVAPEVAEFYSQTPEWSECREELQCADVRVPLDWDEPTAGEITIRVARNLASGTKIGSLFVNPGGPGASGVDLVEQIGTLFGERLLESYDVVGFDPRGVGESAPVQCLDDAGKDALYSRDFDYSSDKGLAEAFDAWEAYGASCLENTGEVLGNVGTVSAARDLDVLRGVLGDETLAYLGYSYGTSLGATYAALFPQRAGRLVLDGGVDPTLDAHAASLEQAGGFERALRNYVQYCLSRSVCPLDGSVEDGLEQIGELIDRARRSPLPTSDTARGVTATMLFYGIALPLYDNQAWSLLTDALSESITEGTADTFLFLSDFYFDRNPASGTYLSNQTEAFHAIHCADARGSAEPEQMATEAAEILAEAPTMGEFFGYGAVICARWPVPVQGVDVDFSAVGAPPILVVGTTDDPATPYHWSEALAELLDSGVLLTFEGEGHTAYGRSNACIADAVEGFFVDGTVPAEGQTC